MKDDLFLGTRGLLDAARRDGPSSAQKSRIWEGVALAPQLSLVASGASGASKAAARASLHPAATAGVTGAKAIGASALAALTAGKLLLAGAVVGSALTIGLGIFVVRGPLRAHTRPVAEAAATGDAMGHEGIDYAAYAPDVPSTIAMLAEPATTTAPDVKVGAAVGAGVPLVSGGTSPGAANRAVASQSGGDGLMREVARVSEARNDLAMGGAAAALASLDAAARGSSRSLEPEELSLRARALRLLGRDAEASRVEETLRVRYPDNFLSR
jgi:hypothetical protein